MPHASHWTILLTTATCAAFLQPAVQVQGRAVTATATSTQPATGRLPARSVRAHKGEPVSYDFGTVWAYAVTHTYEVKNTSDRTMTIHNVTTNCGCTTVDKWDKQVEPGQVWKVDVTFATGGRRGKIRKSISVTTDDPERPQIELVLTGEIRPRFEISPSSILQLGSLQPSSDVKRTLRITNLMPSPVLLTLASQKTGALKTELREIEQGKRYDLDIETVTPMAETTSLGPIVLQTDLKDQPQLTIPVYGWVQAPVAVVPRVIAVPSLTLKDFQRSVQLQLASGAVAKVIKIESSNPAIKASLERAPAGETQRIQVSIPKGTVLADQGETLTVYTDNPQFAKLVCRIYTFHLSQGRAP